ncbi:hypothetical protein [Sagittula sp. SSi028]|uniref:hypothetical protein n=1 Tax=Sagittula sp. SSi028 TaxID=3400636 RepID=UPI003AF5701B
MLITFGKHSTDPTGDGAQDAVSYMCAPEVTKQGHGAAQKVPRSPAPEILLGEPAMARAAIRIAPGKHKYRFAVLSFAPEDISTERFNAGDPVTRKQVSELIETCLDLAFAGVPKPDRPPVLITTHTHLGRMELNVLLPRWVVRPDGKRRSFNPDPPGRNNRAGWQAFEDVVNDRFGWADPRDPFRQQLVRHPDWYLKRQRNAERFGDTSKRDIRQQLTAKLLRCYELGLIRGRKDVFDAVRVGSTHFGMRILSHTDRHITIGPPDAPAPARIRLTGALFSAQGLSAALSAEKARQLRDKRWQEIKHAPQRLAQAWARRAKFNLSRYGLGLWPDPAPLTPQRQVQMLSQLDPKPIPHDAHDETTHPQRAHQKTAPEKQTTDPNTATIPQDPLSLQDGPAP